MLAVAIDAGIPESVCVSVAYPCSGYMPVVDATARPASNWVAVKSAIMPSCDKEARFAPDVDCVNA